MGIPRTKPTAKKRTRSNRARVAGLRDDSTAVPKDLWNLPTTLKIQRKKGKRKVGRPQKWNRQRLVEYVCGKIASGQLVTDVCRRIGVRAYEFRLITETKPEYAAMYAKARKEEAFQMRVYAQMVAEGRDRLSRLRRRRFERLASKLRKQKHPGANQILHDAENSILQRNRLQLDAAKWIAKVTDPEKFGDKTDVAVTGPTGGAMTIGVQFIDPSGKAVKI
jgi:hypothetical protein